MITLSLENVFYMVSIIVMLCGAAYRIGYENGRSKRK